MDKELASEFERLIPHLRRYALHLNRTNPDAADDLVQETLERAMTRLHLFEPGTNLRAWLFTIQRNCFLNRVRREARIDHNSVDVYENEHRVAIAAPQESTVMLRRVGEAFAELSDDHQEALMLVAIEGLTYDEAAAVIGVATGTVKSRVGRARERLQILLEEIGERRTPRLVS